MKHINPLSCILVTSLSVLFSCTDTADRNETNQVDSTSTSQMRNTADVPSFDPATDPLTLAGERAKKLGDTLGMRMYEFAVKPGESWGIHTHPDHTVYVLQGGTMALYMREAGRQDTLNFPSGTALISGPLTDSGRNVGKTTIRMIVTDVYRPR